MKFYISFLFLIYLINFSNNEKTCEENDHTCQEKKYEIEFPTLNEDFFKFIFKFTIFNKRIS